MSENAPIGSFVFWTELQNLNAWMAGEDRASIYDTLGAAHAAFDDGDELGALPGMGQLLSSHLNSHFRTHPAGDVVAGAVWTAVRRARRDGRSVPVQFVARVVADGAPFSVRVGDLNSEIIVLVDLPEDRVGSKGHELHQALQDPGALQDIVEADDTILISISAPPPL